MNDRVRHAAAGHRRLDASRDSQRDSPTTASPSYSSQGPISISPGVPAIDSAIRFILTYTLFR
jgi:hypothetical protein